MSRLRIGEALLAKGLVTPEQLQKALRDQEILGGHLGTCLIELGFVSEESLGKTLGELLNMRYASWSALAEAPEDAIKTLSVELVERYSVVPLLLEERTLHVATVAPRTLSALSRATGKRIVPWIAPEIRILQAMELHYGIPLQPRYIKIREQLDSAAFALPKAAKSETEAEPSNPEDEWISAPDDNGPDSGAAFGYGRSWRDIAEQHFDEPAAPAAHPIASVAPMRPTPVPVAAPIPGPAAPAFASSASAGVRRETIRHATGLLRVRMMVNSELSQLGFPIDDNATADNLARWVAKASLDLTFDPRAPNRARDESGYTYRIIRTLESPEDGCVLSVPLADRVDFFVGIRLDRHFRVHTVIRASYEALAAAGTPRGGEVLLPWARIESQGTGIEVLYNDGVTQAETATAQVGVTTRP